MLISDNSRLRKNYFLNLLDLLEQFQVDSALPCFLPCLQEDNCVFAFKFMDGGHPSQMGSALKEKNWLEKQILSFKS